MNKTLVSFFFFPFHFISRHILKGTLKDVFWENISDRMLDLQEGMENKAVVSVKLHEQRPDAGGIRRTGLWSRVWGAEPRCVLRTVVPIGEHA